MSADGVGPRDILDRAGEGTESARGGVAPDLSESRTLTSGRLRLGIAAVAVAFYAVFVLRTSFTVGGTRFFVLFEDAMISMRYAHHLADGHGLVWNVGERPIEGFTNLLWVLWMSVAHLLGLSESKISLFPMLSGVVILLGIGLVTARIARKLAAVGSWVAVSVLVATLFDYPLVFWTLRGMEVGALTLTVYGLLWLALENEDRFSLGRTLGMGALSATALLIRSDSVVAVGLICLYGFLTCSRRWLFAAVVGSFAGGVVFGQTMFRKAYFHESFPNTYYLKLDNISVVDRVKRGLFVALEVLALHLAVPLAVLFGGARIPALSGLWRDKTSRRLGLLFAVFVAQIAYATFVGGDAWEWMLYANRYMCVGMPALIILVTVVLERVITSGRPDVYAAFAKRASHGLALAGAVLVVLNLFAKVRPETGIAATIVFSKTAFAAGGAMLLSGMLLRLADPRRGIVEGLAALRARLGSQKTVAAAALALTALLWLPSHLLPGARWAAENAAQYAEEARYTRLGLLIAATTPPDLRIAVAAAGATPYFSERPTEDLLGKNDRHVAKLAPRGVFSPGHDKWDYAYSLGERNAQLIVEPVDLKPEDKEYIASLGFEELENGMLLRRDAPVARRDLVGRDVADGAALVSVLGEARTSPDSIPPFRMIDFGVVFVFGLAALGLVRAIARDTETYGHLPSAPTSEDAAHEPDEISALAGADARAIPTLDGMRGIAVVLVLMFHFAWTFPGGDPLEASSFVDKVAVQLHAFMWSGWIGVDLFFVLSGYLITRGLVTPSKTGLGTRLKMFWMRRVLRIFPLYYAVLVVGTVVTLALGARWIPGLPYWLYMQNYLLAFDDEVMRWTAHFWSLAIEEQFYFIWPIVALVVSRGRLVPTILILVVLTVGLRAGLTFGGHRLAIFQHWYGSEPAALEHGIAKFVYRATFTRADGLLLGAFVAVTQREVRHPLALAWRRLRLPILIGTALALAALYVWATGLNDYDRRVIGVGYVTLALFFASAVSLCADACVGDRTRRILSSRSLVSCGKVSYGMYIFHWPLVVLGVPVLEKVQRGMSTASQMAVSGLFVVAGIAVIWAFASVSFRFFEMPFLRLKGRFHG